MLGNSKWASLIESGKAATHVSRWFKFCSDQATFKSVQCKTPGNRPSKSAGNDVKKVSPKI